MNDERRLAAGLFALAFCVLGVPRVFTQTAAHALFIEAHGAAAMPWAYAAEAAAVPLAGALYIAASRRLGLRTLWCSTLVLQVAALLALRVALALQWPLATGAAIVWFEIEFVLSSLVAWGMAHQLMDLRQGKRRFGWVAAGEPAAVIVCGLLTPPLLRAVNAADLLLLSAAGAAVGMLLVRLLLQRHLPVADDELASPPTAVRQGRARHVALMVGMVALGQLAYFFVDAAFYLEAGRAHPDAQALAAFLGLYSAAVGVASLLASVLLAPWLLRRHGVRGGLLALPLTLGLGALVTLAVGSSALLTCVVVNKLIDQSLRYTVDKSTFVTLLQPLPAAARVRTQAALEGIVEPLAGGVAALLLWGLYAIVDAGAAGVTLAVGAVAAAWLPLALHQAGGYRRTLALSLPASSATLPTALYRPLAQAIDALPEQGPASPQALQACWQLLARADATAALCVRCREGHAAGRARALELLEIQVSRWLTAGHGRRLARAIEGEGLTQTSGRAPEGEADGEVSP